MKTNLILLAIFLVFLAGNYFYFTATVIPQPEKMRELKAQIEEKNKQLLAAQILSEKREGITMLIKSNLIENPNDSLAEKASVPFLQYLTSNMDALDIRLVSLNPLNVIGTEDSMTVRLKEFLQVPYEMKIIATYEELGKFLDILEKSPHLIKVADMTVSNELDQATFAEEIVGKPRQHMISLQINTIAILKASFRSEPG
jgi:Tfp pilus assembly protein PilO